MIDRGNADIWKTLVEASAKAQKLPLRKCFNALKNNFQNVSPPLLYKNKDRRLKEELNDLRFRVSEYEQRITFLISKITKLEFEQEANHR